MASQSGSNTIPTVNPGQVIRTITDDVDLLALEGSLVTLLTAPEGALFCVTSFHVIPVSVIGADTVPSISLVDQSGRTVANAPNLFGADDGQVANASLVSNPAPLCAGPVQASIDTPPSANAYVVRFAVAGFYL